MRRLCKACVPSSSSSNEVALALPTLAVATPMMSKALTRVESRSIVNQPVR